MTTLEEDLRQTLRHGNGVAPGPGLAEHMLRRVRRRQTRRRFTVAGVTAVAALAAAVALVGHWVGGDTRVASVPAGADQCQGVAVRALGAGTSGEDTRNLAVILTNTAPHAVCQVSPDLTLALLVGGRRLDVEQLAPVRDHGPVDLGPGQALDVELVWDNWCGGQVPAAGVELGLPGGGRVTTRPFQPSPTCLDKAVVSTVRVFQLGLTEVSTEPSAPPSAAPSGETPNSVLGYRAALKKWVTCLRDGGVQVYGPDAQLDVSVNPDPALEPQRQACAQIQPHLSNDVEQQLQPQP